MQCDVTGQLGSCSCGGLDCGTKGCQLFYIDSDNDKHGDPSGTLAANTAVAGCIGDGPKTANGHSYVASADDCDDTDPQVFKGQTAFFDTANPHIGFDYDCSGSQEKEQPEYPGKTCQVCTLYYPGPSDAECYPEPTCSTQCCGRASQAGFNCGFACPNGGGGYECCPLPSDPYQSEQGFEQVVPCGQTAQWHVCGICNAEPDEHLEHTGRQPIHEQDPALPLSASRQADGGSANMRHMAVVRDFACPLAPTPTPGTP